MRLTRKSTILLTLILALFFSTALHAKVSTDFFDQKDWKLKCKVAAVNTYRKGKIEIDFAEGVIQETPSSFQEELQIHRCKITVSEANLASLYPNLSGDKKGFPLGKGIVLQCAGDEVFLSLALNVSESSRNQGQKVLRLVQGMDVSYAKIERSTGQIRYQFVNCEDGNNSDSRWWWSQ